MHPATRVLAIADDMTGALEAGAKLAELGSLVTTARELPAFDGKRAIVTDTETRHSSAVDAGARIDRIAQACRRLQIEIIFKKTDSTLRGNIGVEIQALAHVYPERPIVFVPAYPKLGRTVRRGHLHVDGQLVHRTAFAFDALNPVGTSYIPEVIAPCALPLRLYEKPSAEPLESGQLHIFDSETEADVAAIIQLALKDSTPPIFCGPGSVASHLATALGCSQAPVDLPIATSGLVVNGSRHEVAARQICDAQTRGWPLLSARDPAENPMATGWAILSASGPAEQTAIIVRDLLSRKPVDCLVVFGGDTAFQILLALGIFTVIPVCELFPGIPISRAGGLNLVTKAGGFGPVDLLSRIREALSGRR